MQVNDVKIRKMKCSDLAKVENLARSVRFDVGIRNFDLYYRTSPNGWEVAENEKQEIVGFCGKNQMNNGVIYGYSVVVREDYRGKGITREFSRFWYTEPVMGSSTHFSIERYKFDTWLEKRLSFFGLPDRKKVTERTNQSQEFVLEVIDPKHLLHVSEYDKNIVRVDRENFLREWLFPSQTKEDDYLLSRSVAAWKNNRCLGYGTLRKFSFYYAISPLYAEDACIARALYYELSKLLKFGEPLYIPGLATQRVNFEFCFGLGMCITETETRNASLSAKMYSDSLPMEKVFAVQEFWPV